MKDDVIVLLKQLGYEATEQDDALIDTLITKVANDITAALNSLEVPEGMYYDHVLGVCGEFLLIKDTSGQLNLSALSFDGIDTITEGDTTVKFSNGASDESSFNNLIKYLNGWESKVPAFRRLAW